MKFIVMYDIMNKCSQVNENERDLASSAFK
jgi:hypothetical protein